MRLEVEPSTPGDHHWRLVVTADETAHGPTELQRRLRVVGGNVRAKLDYAKPTRHDTVGSSRTDSSCQASSNG